LFASIPHRLCRVGRTSRGFIVEARKHVHTPALLMIAALVLSAILIGIGIYRATDKGDWIILSVGSLGIVVTIAAWALAIALAPHPEDQTVVNGRLEAMGQQMRQMTELLARIGDQQLLSDRAKAVAFREKDRDALRRAILEEINRGDWDAALRLADDMEASFGYRAEAARFRDEVRARRQEQVRRQVDEVVAVIDRHTRSEQWNSALREAERLMTIFPENEQVKNLPQEIERRRQDHKNRLLESWREAVNRHDTDGSIEILKQLDAYLTPAEAAGLEDTVRTVFKEKREQLGKQFGDAVTAHRWLDAIRIGESIARDFPESRMAQEVKEKMPALRQRASELGAAAFVRAGF
jgi:hypothetical protein